MVLKDLLLDTVATLWKNKLRTFLTMFGIAWGIISIILMVAAGEGLRVGQARVAANFGKDHDRVRRPHQPSSRRRARRPRYSMDGH